MSDEDYYVAANDESESIADVVDTGGIENARAAAQTLENMRMTVKNSWWSDDEAEAEEEQTIRSVAPLAVAQPHSHSPPPIRVNHKRASVSIAISHPELKVASALASHQNALIQYAIGHVLEDKKLANESRDVAFAASKALGDHLQLTESLEAYTEASCAHAQAVLIHSKERLAPLIAKSSAELAAALAEKSENAAILLANLDAANTEMWLELEAHGASSTQFEKLAVESVSRAIQIGAAVDMLERQTAFENGNNMFSFSHQILNDSPHSHHFVYGGPLDLMPSEAFLAGLRSMLNIIKNDKRLRKITSIITGEGSAREELAKSLDKGFKNKFVLFVPVDSVFDETKANKELLLLLRQSEALAIQVLENHLVETKESVKKTLKNDTFVAKTKPGTVVVHLEVKAGRTVLKISENDRALRKIKVVEVIGARNGTVVLMEGLFKPDANLPPPPKTAPGVLPPPIATDGDEDEEEEEEEEEEAGSAWHEPAPAPQVSVAPTQQVRAVADPDLDVDDKPEPPKPKFTHNWGGQPKQPFKTDLTPKLVPPKAAAAAPVSAAAVLARFGSKK